MEHNNKLRYIERETEREALAKGHSHCFGVGWRQVSELRAYLSCILPPSFDLIIRLFSV